MEDIVCRLEPPAAIEVSGEPGITTRVVQSIGNVPNAAQGVEAPPVQVEPMLFTLGHNLSPAVGKVKFNGTACARLTGLSVGGGNSPENPVNEDTEPVVTVNEDTEPVVTAAALGSKATTQQEGVPLPPPFSGSPKVTEAGVYLRKIF